MSSRSDSDQVWKALADPSRRAILDHLADRALTTGELVERFPALSRTAVMKHLGILVEANLVLPRREGRKRWNYLNPIPIQAIHDRWLAKHLTGKAQALLRLKAVAEVLEDEKRSGTKEESP